MPKKYLRQYQHGQSIHVFVVEHGNTSVLHMNVTHPLINILDFQHWRDSVRPSWDVDEITVEQFLQYRDQALRAFDLI